MARLCCSIMQAASSVKVGQSQGRMGVQHPGLPLRPTLLMMSLLNWIPLAIMHGGAMTAAHAFAFTSSHMPLLLTICNLCNGQALQEMPDSEQDCSTRHCKLAH